MYEERKSIMLEQIPTREDLTQLIGEDKFVLWESLCNTIENLYDMEKLWGKGGREWIYEYKYRRGGKTLCALYAKENGIGLLIIFGKAEREKFEGEKANYSSALQTVYDDATTYHDGKWMLFELEDMSLFPEFAKMLAIKRRPNRK